MKGVNALNEEQQRARTTLLVMNTYAREEGLRPETLQGDAKYVFQALSAAVHGGQLAQEGQRLGLQQVAALESNDAGAISRSTAHLAGFNKVEAIYARLQA